MTSNTTTPAAAGGAGTGAEAAAFPASLQHKHGLSEWSPMLPERSMETIQPGEPPTERFYRCQRIGCDAVARIGVEDLRSGT